MNKIFVSNVFKEGMLLDYNLFTDLNQWLF